MEIIKIENVVYSYFMFTAIEIVENHAFERKYLGCCLGSKKIEDYLQVCLDGFNLETVPLSEGLNLESLPVSGKTTSTSSSEILHFESETSQGNYFQLTK